MQSQIVKYDSSSGALQLAPPGYFGFIIQPALPRVLGSTSQYQLATPNIPGRFPLEVSFEDNRPAFDVDGPNLFAFEDPLPRLRLTAAAYGYYRVTLLERPREFFALGQRVRRLGLLSAGAETLSTTTPTLSSEGWEIPWGAKAWQAYFDAANQSVELWVYSKFSNQSSPGYWFKMETVDLTAASVGQVVGREVLLGSGVGYPTAVPQRLYIRTTAGSALNVSVEVEVEL